MRRWDDRQVDGGVRDEKDYIVANEIPEVSEGGGSRTNVTKRRSEKQWKSDLLFAVAADDDDGDNAGDYVEGGRGREGIQGNGCRQGRKAPAKREKTGQRRCSS